MESSVLVIVVTYNGMQWLDRCLTSIRESSVRADVMVIDNGSTDGTQKRITDMFPECILHQNSENMGFGAANNIGFRYAIENKYDYVYLLNQDAWVKYDTLENLIMEHLSHQEYGIISPLQLQSHENHLDDHFCRLISRCRPYVEESFLQTGQTLFEIPFVMAAHWLISKACLEKVGGFSPSFYHYGEDNNYCDRVRYHGFSVGFTTKASAVHDRENRMIDTTKRLYLEHVHRIVDVSCPSGTPQSLFYYLKDCIHSVRIRKSFLPAYYYVELLSGWRKWKQNRQISMSEKAFL